jgi:hypothetical protein
LFQHSVQVLLIPQAIVHCPDDWVAFVPYYHGLVGKHGFVRFADALAYLDISKNIHKLEE